MQKPTALRPGHTIGLLGPSSSPKDPAKLPAAVAYLESLGYRVKTTESCTAKYGYLAGSDVLRAQDINRMFADDAVDGILCVRGGYGAGRILGRLNYPVIRGNPKVFCGYSDITALHGAFREQANLVTFHGPMATSDMANETNDLFTMDSFWRAVGNPESVGLLCNPPEYPRETLAPGRAIGPLIGGNLSLLCSGLGTPYSYNFDGAILFMEEVDEPCYAVDRYLTQMKNAGGFQRCAGILLGEFTNVRAENNDGCLSLEQVFADLLGDCGKPVLTGIRCGHCTPTLTLPFGVMCEMDAEAKTVRVLEGAVK